MNNPSLLIGGESPFCFQPLLAKHIGLNEAIVLQQLSYLLSREGNGKKIGGERWVFNTYEQWQQNYFSWWSIATIQRIFAELESKAFVISCQPEGVMSRRKYYRLGGACLHLTEERIHEMQLAQEDEHINLGLSASHQKEMMGVATGDLPLTETSSETTSETHTAAPIGSAKVKAAHKPREANVLLDALASVGGANPRETPPSRWSAIQKYLREIKTVTPDVTPEEIKRRERAYQNRYTTAAVTPDALAKHWGEFSRTETTVRVRVGI